MQTRTVHPNPISPEVADLLWDRYQRYNNPDFIPPDPVSIPHRFTLREDAEIAGLFAATLAWGKRELVLRSCNRLMDVMEQAPFAFVMQGTTKDWARVSGFVHRTFNSEDALYFLRALRHIYSLPGGLQGVFEQAGDDVFAGLVAYRQVFLGLPGAPSHVAKHIPDVARGAAAKRVAMFLRWMVRKDNRGVDLGLWTQLSPAQLVLPLDVHTGGVARALGLLTRKQNDWLAVQELTLTLAQLDPTDPVKFDFALFGLGIYENYGQ